MAHDDLERASNSPAQGSTADPPSRRYGVAQGTSNIGRVRLPSLKSKTPSLKSKTPSLKSKTPPSTDKLLETELHANVDRPPAQARVALFQTRTKMLDPFAGLAPPLTRSAPDMNAWPASKLQSSDPGRAALVRKTSMQVCMEAFGEHNMFFHIHFRGVYQPMQNYTSKKGLMSQG